uniref:Uncharacterized protein n=1 Tax=Cyprinus carpio TaxID=7962 RepID=A0A8C1LDW9_CYPCA
FTSTVKFRSFVSNGLSEGSVIVEKVSGSQIVDIDKRKYLVPSDITVPVPCLLSYCNGGNILKLCVKHCLYGANPAQRNVTINYHIQIL